MFEMKEKPDLHFFLSGLIVFGEIWSVLVGEMNSLEVFCAPARNELRFVNSEQYKLLSGVVRMGDFLELGVWSACGEGWIAF